MASQIEELSVPGVERFKDMVEKLKGDELEDYEVYACLAKYVSDNLPRATSDVLKGAHFPAVVSYLDKHGITVTEVLSYVHNDAGQLLANEKLAQRFAALMDYFENKGVPAEEVFESLEVFVESDGESIYNAFGNLTEVDYFNYATVSGYLNSRGISSESLRQFLEYIVCNERQYVESIRPVNETNVSPGGGLVDVLSGKTSNSHSLPLEHAGVRTGNGEFEDAFGGSDEETDRSWAHRVAGNPAVVTADIFTLPQEPEHVNGYEEDSLTPELQPPVNRNVHFYDSPPGSSAQLHNIAPYAGHDDIRGSASEPNGLDSLTSWRRQQEEVLRSDTEALQALSTTRLKAFPGEVADLRAENHELRKHCEHLELQMEKMQLLIDKNDLLHHRLANDMDSAMAAVKRGEYKEFNSLRTSLRQQLEKSEALDQQHMHKFSEEEVEGLKDKLKRLHDKLSAPLSSKLPRKKERQLLTFQDFLETLEEAEQEVSQLRDESSTTMKQLVLKKVELAEAQEEVTKTKRALIRAVNKQMQLAYKIDEMRQMYLSAVSRQQSSNRFQNRG